MPIVKRDVCTGCGAVWFNTPQNRCPACSAPVTKDRDCELHTDGRVTPVPAQESTRRGA